MARVVEMSPFKSQRSIDSTYLANKTALNGSSSTGFQLMMWDYFSFSSGRARNFNIHLYICMTNDWLYNKAIFQILYSKVLYIHCWYGWSLYSTVSWRPCYIHPRDFWCKNISHLELSKDISYPQWHGAIVYQFWVCLGKWSCYNGTALIVKFSTVGQASYIGVHFSLMLQNHLGRAPSHHMASLGHTE